jgi:hypothetical protein
MLDRPRSSSEKPPGIRSISARPSRVAYASQGATDASRERSPAARHMHGKRVISEGRDAGESVPEAQQG